MELWSDGFPRSNTQAFRTIRFNVLNSLADEANGEGRVSSPPFFLYKGSKPFEDPNLGVSESRGGLQSP
jgi:hypothetical protein